MPERRVLVTGSDRGIGRAVAIRLAEDGFDIAVCCRSGREGAEEVCAETERLGRKAELLMFDVSDREASEAAITASIERNGAFWGVVPNAGIVRDAPFPRMSGDEWDSVILTNLGSFYNVVRPCVMPMIRLHDGGRIVAISSVSGVIGNRGQVNYAASKGGLIAASKSLALELGKRGITVNAVAPGVIDNGMADKAVIDAMLPAIPLRRAGTPEDVAGAVSFLFSPSASYVTRQVIGVNGGLI